jgi:Na+-transporting methylmalonyl-CoA/oxaloacetate decarboxylase gamma subunit
MHGDEVLILVLAGLAVVLVVLSLAVAAYGVLSPHDPAVTGEVRNDAE